MGAFAILLLMDKTMFHSKVADSDQHRLPEAVRFALADPRNVDVAYTVFDTVNKVGSQFNRLVIQCGKGIFFRKVVTVIRHSFRAMQAFMVLVEISKAEFVLQSAGPHWDQFRASDLSSI